MFHPTLPPTTDSQKLEHKPRAQLSKGTIGRRGASPKVQPMMDLDAIHLEPGVGSLGSGPLADSSISDVV